MDIAAGTILADRFEVVRKLGAGSMGSVYLVEDLELSRDKRAIKILHSHVANEIQLVERFKQEMRLASQLSHPNIVRFYDLGELPSGQYYISMEYFEGQSIIDVLSEQPEEKFPFEKAVVILYYLAGALHHMHSRNIIHRDIKPGNVLIGRDGRVKLTDLGIARSLVENRNLTNPDEMLGTPPFMAPERFVENQAVTHLTDVYAFGILAFMLVSGKVPFECNNSMEYLRAHLFKPISNLSEQGVNVPAWYQKLIEKCCAKNPEARFQTMGEVAEVIGIGASKMNLAIPALEILLGGKRKREEFSLSSMLSYGGSYLKQRLLDTSQNIKNLPIAMLIAFSSLLFFMQLPAIRWSGFLERYIEYRLMDVFFQVRGARPSPKDIAIISISERSFEDLGEDTTKLFPRRRIAELLEKLSLYRPKKIILDFRFYEKLDPVIDERLAKSFELTPTYIGKFKSKENNILSADKTPGSWMMPNDFFAAHAKGIFDGTVKKDPIVVRAFKTDLIGGRVTSPMAEVVYEENLLSQDLPFPNDFINFYGGSGSIDTVPIHEVLKSDSLPGTFFENKYVFVGSQLNMSSGYNTTQQPDSFITPFGSNMYGVEIHAATAANLLDKSWIRGFSLQAQFYTAAIIYIFFSLFILGMENQKARVLVSICAVVSVLMSYLFFKNGVYLPIAGFIYIAIVSLITPRAKTLYEKAALFFIGPRNSRL